MAKLLLMFVVVYLGAANAENPPFVLDSDGSTVALEPYAANIIRVTLSMNKDQAVAAPGYGFKAIPATEGWSQQHRECLLLRSHDRYRRGEPSLETHGDPDRYRQVLQRFQSWDQHFSSKRRKARHCCE